MKLNVLTTFHHWIIYWQAMNNGCQKVGWLLHNPWYDIFWVFLPKAVWLSLDRFLSLSESLCSHSMKEVRHMMGSILICCSINNCTHPIQNVWDAFPEEISLNLFSNVLGLQENRMGLSAWLAAVPWAGSEKQKAPSLFLKEFILVLCRADIV